MSNISTTNTNTSTLSSTLSPPPPLRWGIVGCGRVSHDFVQALKHLPPPSSSSTSSTSSSTLPSYSHVVACAARSEDRAKEFAERHGIDTWYGTYEELWKDERVDIVYVGIIHMVRRSIGEQCLMANKHVLLEKPFCLNLEDAQYLINLARHRNLFLMEVSE
jgi:dihydrodiol dehydrogenase / D-xylose 1-dehydrogenase (NADP)